MSSGKVVLGLLAGVAVGALAGLLFAPAKGSRTRRRILKKGEDYADGLKEKFDDLLESVTKKMEKVKEEVSNFKDKKVVKPEKAETAS